MKQTAVEWLHEKLAQSSQEELVGNINLWFKQAKEMEKQQIIDCGNSCALKQAIHNRKIDLMNLKQLEEFSKEENITFGEQYYNETFKNK